MNIYKKAILGLALTCSLSSLANATTIADPNNGEQHLYQVWNTLFGASETSSQALFKTYGVPDWHDNVWTELNGHLNLDVKYAAKSETIGYQEIGSPTLNKLATVKFGVAASGNYTDVNATFKTVSKKFAWVDSAVGYGLNDSWYSDDRNDHTLDHFVALEVPQEYVNYYNANFKIGSKDPLRDHVYLFAFEDSTLEYKTDKDYNDVIF